MLPDLCMQVHDLVDNLRVQLCIAQDLLHFVDYDLGLLPHRQVCQLFFTDGRWILLDNLPESRATDTQRIRIIFVGRLSR